MSTRKAFFLIFSGVALLSTEAYGVEFILKPISASGSHTFDGNEIILEGGGQYVTLEIRVDGWGDPDQGLCNDGATTCSVRDQDCPGGLEPCDAVIGVCADGATMCSVEGQDCPEGLGPCYGNVGVCGDGVTLCSLEGLDCPEGSCYEVIGVCADQTTMCSTVEQNCPAGLGPCYESQWKVYGWSARIDSSGYEGVLGPALPWCDGDEDCQVFDPYPAAHCNIAENECQPDACAFIDSTKPEYIFYGLGAIATVSTFTPDYGYLASLYSGGVDYAGVYKYCGTLVLDVPGDAAGSFTIGFIETGTETAVLDPWGVAIMPSQKKPAVITIACQDAQDCSDDNACTEDVCNPDGTCSNPPNYDEEVYCCNPTNGDL
ncbi:MAG: hypothetical protein JSW71_06755, partial [Gemmatimonadota bacterium]